MLTWEGTDFLLDGEKFHIYSGAMHYFRVLPEYWEDRLRKLKAAGFNTVETYVCWNLHEPRKGEFDFSGRLDLVRFLETARKVGLYALVRPGPYICAEWDFGGLPAWLLRDKNLHLRCSDPAFLAHVEDFFRALLPRLAPLQCTRGGNVLAMQVENEYGSFGNDKAYLRALRDMIRRGGIDVLLFTSDGPSQTMLSGGTVEGALPTVNFGSRPAQAFRSLEALGTPTPKMCTEFWCGWFDHWGEKHHTRPPEELLREVEALLDEDASFSLYMFHGGTNFGFTAGANQTLRYRPTVTSYDYDAPLNEYGDYTPQYYALRELMHRRQGLPLSPLLPRPRLQTIGPVELTERTGLFDNLDRLGARHHSPTPESMEHYGQSFGLIYYETVLPGPCGPATLTLRDLHDRAHIYRDGTLLRILDRAIPADPLGRVRPRMSMPFEAAPAGTRLGVLVEAMGRVNYGPDLPDRKGISGLLLDNQSLMDFTVTTLPLDDISGLDFSRCTGYPMFLQGGFEARSQADCFVQLDGFTKGLVFVNGFNLGRYWNRGPQKRLYLPGKLLRVGEMNKITVMELVHCNNSCIQIVDSPDLG